MWRNETPVQSPKSNVGMTLSLVAFTDLGKAHAP
jgi:hypothetical protein